MKRRLFLLGIPAPLSLVPAPPAEASDQRWYGYRCASCGRPARWVDVGGECRQCGGKVETIERGVPATR